MQNDSEQLDSVKKRNNKALSIVFDVLLWVVIGALLTFTVLRLFVFGKIRVSGESMTSPYYDDPVVSTYDPECTFHNDDIVRLNKTVKPKRGDVAVFYKYHVDSKFKAMFAHGDDAGEDGKYEKLIKRIVALAGDSLWLEAQGANEYKLVVQTVDGDVLYEDYYVKNDHVLDVEAFILSDNTIAGTGCLKNTDKEHPHIVQEGCFFAMGDNRGNSADSRGSLGDVPYDQIYGIVRS